MNLLNCFYCIPKHNLVTQEFLIVFGRSSLLFWYVGETLPAEGSKH